MDASSGFYVHEWESRKPIILQGSGVLLHLMYGSRAAEAISATDTMNQIRLAELFASTIAEHAGIVAASAIYSFGRVSGPIKSRLHIIECEHAR